LPIFIFYPTLFSKGGKLMSKPNLETENDFAVQTSNGLPSKNKPIPSIATGASSVGALAIGAFAAGAIATGAMAIGVLAIGKLVIKRFNVKKMHINALEVDELTVRNLKVLKTEEKAG
jgi:hypothetical protein